MSLTEAERALVAETVPMIKQLASNMARRFRHIPADDFMSAGSVAAVFAARNFDPSRGVEFEAFAYKRIRGAMIRDATTEALGSVHIAIARGLRDYDATARAPSELTLDEALEDSPDAARQRALAWLRQQAAESAVGSLFVANQGAEGGVAEIESTDAGVRMAREERRRALEAAVAELADDERYFVRRYYADDADLDTIARELGVVKRTVSRIHARVKEVLERRLRVAGVG